MAATVGEIAAMAMPRTAADVARMQKLLHEHMMKPLVQQWHDMVVQSMIRIVRPVPFSPKPVYRGKPQHFWKWMRYRIYQGMALKDALIEHQEWMQKNGTTLEGYIQKYSDGTLNGDNYAERIWQADTVFLEKLVKLGMLQHSGHDTDDALAWSILGRGLAAKKFSNTSVIKYEIDGDPNAFIK